MAVHHWYTGHRWTRVRFSAIPPYTQEDNLNVVVKPVPNLTPSERRRCAELSFGDTGYMVPMMKNEGNRDDCYAILALKGRMLAGWAMMIPTKYLDEYWRCSPYARRKAVYSYQMFVRPRQRGQGLGKLLMVEGQKICLRPLVWPHDAPSGAFYANYDVVTDWDGRDHMTANKKKGKFALK